MVFGRPALQLGPSYRLELAVRELERLPARAGKRRPTLSLLPLSHRCRKLRSRSGSNTLHAPRTKRRHLLAECRLLPLQLQLGRRLQFLPSSRRVLFLKLVHLLRSAQSALT